MFTPDSPSVQFVDSIGQSDRLILQMALSWLTGEDERALLFY